MIDLLCLFGFIVGALVVFFVLGPMIFNILIDIDKGG